MIEFIQESILVSALRQSLWLYPIVNTMHILGIALLVGAIVPMDLRLLGFWKNIQLTSVVQLLQNVAITGLVLALTTGSLLFVTQTEDYLQSKLFITKMFFVFLTLGNTVAMIRSAGWQSALLTNNCNGRIKLQAAISLLLWIVVIFLGRFIGYR